MGTTANETSLVTTILQAERRAGPRARLGRRALARPFGPEFNEEVHTILNASRDGLYFQTQSKHYTVDMPVSVIEDYSPETRYRIPCFGKVVRVDTLPDGSYGVAVQILMR